MAPLQLEGETLGQKHKHYNKLVKQAIDEKQPAKAADINYEENDIDNLFKIDIASNNKDLDTILKVLKCKDMLYVSRAIRQCTWLLTDPQYAHLINPEYLQTELFPEMRTKGKNKLLLHIRLHLKDEKRVDEFYEYYEQRDLHTACKWLPNCSLPVIEKAVATYASKLKSQTIIKRLCRKSITVLEIFMRDYYCDKRNVMKFASSFLKTHTEKYLEIAEKGYEHDFPILGPKAVQFIMKKCPNKILDNFDKYSNKIDLATFAKCIKKEDIKGFLLKQAKNEKLRRWFNFDRLKHFIKYLPKEGRFEFIKEVFIDKINKEDDKDIPMYESEYQDCAKVAYCCSIESNVPNSSANIYRWYQFAPFNTAFTELKKMIRSESSPEERCAMLAVLLTTASRNMQHIQTLLQFYHDKHINEPFKFKSQFINKIMTQTSIYQYDEKTWNILNELFHCMEVYIESNNNVQPFIQTIIVYKIIHNEKVPEIIEKKFEFNTLKKIQNKLNESQKDQIFQYLHNLLQMKLNNTSTSTQKEIDEIAEQIEKALNLLTDWKKDIVQFPWVLNKLKEIVEIKQTKLFIIDLARLYNANKTWRKHMFQESLLMNPTEEACINALKHGPAVLYRHKTELESLISNDSLILKQMLNKLRIYWSSSLAEDLITSYQKRFNQPNGHKALICGLCILLPRQKLVEIIIKYAPSDSKINWSEADELVLSSRKNIARHMYLARPQPDPEMVLLYAKGSYLQFVLPSLNSIFHNLSSKESRNCSSKLLDAPVSLQKHGIRLAFEKLKTEEVQQIFTDIWKTSKNSSIRTVLFKHTFDLLRREKQPAVIIELWEVLSMFIDNLTLDENKIIYNTLGKVKDVPKSVQGDYCRKSYQYLKSLPPKANCKYILQKIENDMPDIMEQLDEDFLASIALDFIENKFIKEKNEYEYDHLMHLISTFLLGAKDKDTSIRRYQKVLLPLLEHSFRLWNTLLDEDYYVRRNLKRFLNFLHRDFSEYVFKVKTLIPVEMFVEIQNKIENALPLVENYRFLRCWKLCTAFIKELDNHKVQELVLDKGSLEGPKDPWNVDNQNWNNACIIVAPDFAKIVKQYLKEDINQYNASIYFRFLKSMSGFFRDFNISQQFILEMCKLMLENGDSVEIYLLVLELLPNYGVEDDREKMKEVRKTIYSHTSVELKMRYFEIFDKPLKGIEFE